jgi:CRP/FNR family transcriptional regulator, dissimilatory nitrate respiration regulator
MINAYIDIIKKSPLFSGIKKEDLGSLLHCLAPKINNYSKNETIVNEGESVERFGIVLDGEAVITKENADGTRVIISIVKKCDLFGEMLVFSSHKAWPVTVMVPSSCKVLFLTNSDMVARCGNNCSWHISLLQNFMNVISDKSLMMNKKVDYLSMKSIRGKIAKYLLEQYQMDGNLNLILPLKRNELADFLNVSRPSMSREMCLMRDEGILEFYLSSFKIKDLNALKRCCE